MARLLIILILITPLHAQGFEPEYANVIQLQDGAIRGGPKLILQYHNSDLKIILLVDRRTFQSAEVGDTWAYDGVAWRPCGNR